VTFKRVLGVLAAGILVGNVALAARAPTLLTELMEASKDQGWFKACPQIMADIGDLKEPDDQASEEWRDYVMLKAGCLSEVYRDAEVVAFLKAKLVDGHRDPELLDFLGTSQLRLGKNVEAAATFEEALKGGLPDKAMKSVYGKLAIAYAKQASAGGKVPDQAVLVKAERYAKLAVENDPAGEAGADPMALAQWGHVKLLQQDYDEAIRLFDDALLKSASYPGWPSSAEIRKAMEAQFTLSLGQAHYRKGDKAYGEDLMNKAVEIAPTEKLKTVMRAIRDTTVKPAPDRPGA